MIKAHQLYKNFNGKAALSGVDFSAEQGEKVTLLGPSGSGKTTLLRCLNALESPDKGQVSVQGVRLSTPLQAARLGIGMLFQHFNLFPHMTILENITLSLRHVFGDTQGDARLKAVNALQMIGLMDKAAQYPCSLSGGQKQRAAIARVLALDPKIILFDEPVSALDPENVGDVLGLIEGLSRQNITIILVTHQIAFAREISDRIVFMDNGKILLSEKTEAFFAAPGHPRAEKFLQNTFKYSA